MDSVLSLLSALSTRMPAVVCVRHAGVCAAAAALAPLKWLRADTALADVHILCGVDESVVMTAHACVLSAASPVLRALLARQERAMNGGRHRRGFFVCAPGVSDKMWQHLLSFMYCGKTTLAVAELASFLEVTTELEISNIQVSYEPVPSHKTGRLHFTHQGAPRDNGDHSAASSSDTEVATHATHDGSEVADSTYFRAASQSCFPEPLIASGCVKTEPEAEPTDIGGAPIDTARLERKANAKMWNGNARQAYDQPYSNSYPVQDESELQVEDLSITGPNCQQGPAAIDMLMGLNFGISQESQLNPTKRDGAPLPPPLPAPPLGERLHACSVCRRCFKSSGDLSRHRRVHTGERPYPCRFCPMAFSQSPNRTRHMLRVHRYPVAPPGTDDEPSAPPGDAG